MLCISSKYETISAAKRYIPIEGCKNVFFSAVKTNSVNAVLSWKQNNGAEDAWKLLQQTEQRVSVFEQLLKQ